MRLKCMLYTTLNYLDVLTTYLHNISNVEPTQTQLSQLVHNNVHFHWII